MSSTEQGSRSVYCSWLPVSCCSSRSTQAAVPSAAARPRYGRPVRSRSVDLLWVGHGRPPVGVTRPCIIGERPGRPGASSLALAWAPSHARPFTAHRFGRRHPGHQEGIKTEGLLGPRLRKASATIAAESGATEAELNAMFGWTGHQMAQLYTRGPTARGWPRVRWQSGPGRHPIT